MDLQQKRMPKPEVIYEEKDFLVINKPAGLIVHAARISSKKRDPGSESGMIKEKTLASWLVERYPEIKEVGDVAVHGSQFIVHGKENPEPNLRPGIVHRLDKETSGVMLVARTQKSFEYLKSLFQDHKIKKTYLALAFGEIKPKIGVIEKSIGIKTGTLKRSVHSEKMAKEAVTEYRVLEYLKSDISRLGRGSHEAANLKTNSMHHEPLTFSLAEVMPKTGRTHQIRVHLASIGHPIVGDTLYGGKKHGVWSIVHGIGMMLHASSIEFTTQNGKRMKFEAQPPEEFRNSINVLGGN